MVGHLVRYQGRGAGHGSAILTVRHRARLCSANGHEREKGERPGQPTPATIFGSSPAFTVPPAVPRSFVASQWFLGRRKVTELPPDS